MYTLSTTIEQVGIGNVQPGEWQPRKSFDPFKLAELATSIGDHGQIDPGIVWESPDGALILVAGERRWRALCALRLAYLYMDFSLEKWAELCAAENPRDVPISDDKSFAQWAADGSFLARRVECDDPADLFELALIDNLERENLSTFEEATALRQLQSAKNYTQAVIAKRIGRSQPYVGQRLSLLKMEPRAIEVMSAAPGGIALSIARHVGRIDKAQQVNLASFMVAMDASERAAGTIVSLMLKLSKLPLITSADLFDSFKERWGNRNWKKPADVAETLGSRWDNRTRPLDPNAPHLAPRFKLDWNPRVDDVITLKEADANILPDPAACEFCSFTDGKDTKRRCLKPVCFDRKNTLWIKRDAILNPPDPVAQAPGLRTPPPGAGDWDTSSPSPSPGQSPRTRTEPPKGPSVAAPPERPLPVMTALPVGPKPVVLTAIIQPGEILGERKVFVSIGTEGQAPQMQTGDFADLVTLVEIAIDQYFHADLDGELAVAELETEDLVL